MISGTVPSPARHPEPTRGQYDSSGGRAANDLTGGDTRTSPIGDASRTAHTDPKDNTHSLNPWFEVDLGAPMPIEKIVLFGSRYPSRFYLDKGHRVVSALDEIARSCGPRNGPTTTAAKYPKAIFEFTPNPGGALAGRRSRRTRRTGFRWPGCWMPTPAGRQPMPSCAAGLRATRIAAQVEAFARDFFPLLDSRIPELAKSVPPVSAGKYWRRVGRLEENTGSRRWPGRIGMWRSTAIRRPTAPMATTAERQIITHITAGEGERGAVHSGEIPWIDLPDDPKGRPPPWPTASDWRKLANAPGRSSLPTARIRSRKYLRRWARSWTIGR